MWTLLAEPRSFGGSKTKLYLLGSYGLPLLLFPRRRIWLPVRRVDAPKKQLIRPNGPLRPYSHRVRQSVRLHHVDRPEVFRLPRHSHLRIRLNGVPR
jgi:hypothetical protein